VTPRAALVMCSPFGHEAMSVHRGYVHIARRFAASGIAVLRFDYDGTGDSAGDSRDPGRVPAWIHSIRLARERLTRLSGAYSTYVFGTRLGALLALSEAIDNPADGLILFAPPASGRAWVREVQALQMLKQGQLPFAPSAPEPAVVGFPLDQSTREAISALKYEGLVHPPARHVLLVARDDLPSGEAKLAPVLTESGADVVVCKVPGYAEFVTEDPVKSKLPEQVVEAIVSWVDEIHPPATTAPMSLPMREETPVWSSRPPYGQFSSRPPSPRPEMDRWSSRPPVPYQAERSSPPPLREDTPWSSRPPSPPPSPRDETPTLSLRPPPLREDTPAWSLRSAQLRRDTPGPIVRRTDPSQLTSRIAILGGEIREEAVHFHGLFGILSEPVSAELPQSTAVLLFNIGANHHVGSNRLYVQMARAWSAQGFNVLRLDFSGVGDSPIALGKRENEVYSKYMFQDARAAIDFMVARGAERVVLLGLCSGAYVAYHSAILDPRVSDIILINLLTFHWTDGDSLEIRSRNTHKSTIFYKRAVLKLDTWKRLARGEVNVRGIAGQLAQRTKKRLFREAKSVASRFTGSLVEVTDVERGFRLLDERGTGVLALYGSDDGGIDVIEGHLGPGAAAMDGSRSFRMQVLEGPDHTFTPLWTQHQLVQLIGEYLLERYASSE
jgi:alpha-beta hydrolase superfamily lysophospholipase